MRALSSLVIALLLVANAFAAIQPTLCPSNNGQFLLSFAGIGTTPGYLADIMFYNTAPQDLEWGQPLGPYFDFQEGSSCYFSAMATTGPASLHCGLNLFSDSTRSNQIGTGSIDSNNQLVLVLGSDGYTYVGGNATLNTVLTGGPADRLTNSSLINYRSQSNVQLYFRPMRLYPTTTTEAPIANNLQLSADQQSGYLTLWGSDAWNGTDYVGSLRHTGFDFRAALTCPPVTSAPTPAPTSSPTPPPTTGHATGCPPTDPSAIFTIPSACIGSGQTIQHTSSSSAISMSFTQSDSTTAFSGCNDAQ